MPSSALVVFQPPARPSKSALIVRSKAGALVKSKTPTATPRRRLFNSIKPYVHRKRRIASARSAAARPGPSQGANVENAIDVDEVSPPPSPTPANYSSVHDWRAAASGRFDTPDLRVPSQWRGESADTDDTYVRPNQHDTRSPLRTSTKSKAPDGAPLTPAAMGPPVPPALLGAASSLAASFQAWAASSSEDAKDSQLCALDVLNLLMEELFVKAGGKIDQAPELNLELTPSSVVGVVAFFRHANERILTAFVQDFPAGPAMPTKSKSRFLRMTEWYGVHKAMLQSESALQMRRVNLDQISRVMLRLGKAWYSQSDTLSASLSKSLRGFNENQFLCTLNSFQALLQSIADDGWRRKF